MTAFQQSAPSKAIVIRTHYVDRDLLSLADPLSKDPDYLLVFAVDERNAIISTEGFPKVSLSEETFSKLGLPLRGQNEMWKCGDYVLYAVLDQFPHLERIWLIENDAHVNRTDPLAFFQILDQRSQHDFVATYVEAASPDWFWHKTMSGRHGDVYKCFYPVVRASARAVRHLLDQRRSSEALASSKDPDYVIPNDEAFTTTELMAGRFSVADLNEMGDYYTPHTFNYHSLFHPNDLEPEDGRLYHPVRSGRRYLQRVLLRPPEHRDEILRVLEKMTVDDLLEGEDDLTGLFRQEVANLGDNPERVLGRASLLWQVLVRFPHASIFRAVARVLGEARMPFCLKLLKQHAEFMGVEIEVLENLALGKPAWQSSTCEWSLQADCRKDAEGANNGDRDAPNGFHTGLELGPWWTVDLLDTVGIRLVRIFNRSGFEDRMRSFQILASIDGSTWRQAYQHPEELDIAGVVEVDLPDVQSARYLRVRLPRRSHLHFSEIEVYAG